jgi:hypothetical protein
METQQAKKYIFWIIVFIHFVFIALMPIAPFMVKKYNHIQILLILYLLVIVQWNVLGHCVITEIEHKLNPTLVPDTTWSYAFRFLDKYLDGKLVRNTFLGVFIFSIAYLFYKLLVAKQ